MLSIPFSHLRPELCQLFLEVRLLLLQVGLRPLQLRRMGVSETLLPLLWAPQFSRLGLWGLGLRVPKKDIVNPNSLTRRYTLNPKP